MPVPTADVRHGLSPEAPGMITPDFTVTLFRCARTGR
jgi:hypothetical protein